MELLWPGYAPAPARNNLNVCMHGLRRALADSARHDYIVYHDECYALNSDLVWSLDCSRFARAANDARRAASVGRLQTALLLAQHAVDEYGGSLFENDPRTDWCDAERTALTELFAQTVECLARLRLELGDIDAAESAAQRLLQEDRCRESAHRLLMACYATRGRRDLIARQFRRCVSVLETDLDVAPSVETVQLYRDLTATSDPADPN
jgi:DNA-binding SARP family transcriptional activator